MAPATERFGGGVARRTTTQDNDRSGYAGRCTGGLLRYAFELFSDIHGAVPLLHAPTGDRVQCRWPERLTGAQAETGMMPGTTNRIAHQQPVGERGAIMRAEGTDREQFVPAPREQHRFAVCVPEQHGAFSNG